MRNIENLNKIEKMFYFFKDIAIPISSIIVMIYCTSQVSTVNLNLTDTQKQESISEYDANAIASALSNTYNDVIKYFKTDEFIKDEWIHRRVTTINILDNVFENGYKALESEINTIESSSFKGLKNKEYEDSYYKHSNIEIYADSIKVLDPRIVKMDGNKEIILKKLSSRLYKIKKVESLNDKEYKIIIVDTKEAIT